jgi:hypothetical protein
MQGCIIHLRAGSISVERALGRGEVAAGWTRAARLFAAATLSLFIGWVPSSPPAGAAAGTNTSFHAPESCLSSFDAARLSDAAPLDPRCSRPSGPDPWPAAFAGESQVILLQCNVVGNRLARRSIKFFSKFHRTTPREPYCFLTPVHSGWSRIGRDGYGLEAIRQPPATAPRDGVGRTHCPSSQSRGHKGTGPRDVGPEILRWCSFPGSGPGL